MNLKVLFLINISKFNYLYHQRLQYRQQNMGDIVFLSLLSKKVYLIRIFGVILNGP